MLVNNFEVSHVELIKEYLYQHGVHRVLNGGGLGDVVVGLKDGKPRVMQYDELAWELFSKKLGWCNLTQFFKNLSCEEQRKFLVAIHESDIEDRLKEGIVAWFAESADLPTQAAVTYLCTGLVEDMSEVAYTAKVSYLFELRDYIGLLLVSLFASVLFFLLWLMPPLVQAVLNADTVLSNDTGKSMLAFWSCVAFSCVFVYMVYKCKTELFKLRAELEAKRSKYDVL